jgi:heme exporter protein B
MTTFTATLHRDLRLAFRHKGQLALPPAFFVIAVTLFPLALGPDAKLLALMAPGLLAVAALLAALLALDPLFRADRDDGTLDLLVVAPQPLSLYALGRIIGHWLLTGLPLIVLSPLIGLVLGLPANMTCAVIAVLIPMTALLVLFGTLAAALALGARQGSVLLALLVLPLYSPVLIFGAGAIVRARGGGAWTEPLLLLWAMLALALPIVPLATAAILKEHV